MPSNYKVKFTPLANEDMHKIYEYISSQLTAPMASENLMNDIEEKTRLLILMPYAYPFVADEKLKRQGYRKVVIKNYLILYIADEQAKLVTIMRVLYGGRNYTELL
jgi:addiction module RelE/StbE family toxin